MATESETLLQMLAEIDAERAKAERAAEAAKQKALELQQKGDAVRVTLGLLDIDVPGFDPETARATGSGKRGRKRSSASVTGMVRSAIERLPEQREFDADDIRRMVEDSPNSDGQSVSENAVRKALTRILREEADKIEIVQPGSGRAKSVYRKPPQPKSSPHEAGARNFKDDLPPDPYGWPANRATA